MQIKRHHLAFAFKRSIVDALYGYVVLTALAFFRHADRTGWVICGVSAVIWHVALFGFRLWQSQRRQQVPVHRRSKP
jgi:hypothetical protein